MNNTLYCLVYNHKKEKYVMKKQKKRKHMWYRIVGIYVVKNVIVE